MADVLVRGVPPEDLELIRSAAADSGLSLQRYLRNTLQAQATYLRRLEALAEVSSRFRGQAAVPEIDRVAVLDAIDDAHRERAEQLGNRITW